MVQFLSIIFFLDFFNFCWVFQKFPFFVSPVYVFPNGGGQKHLVRNTEASGVARRTVTRPESEKESCVKKEREITE